MEDYTSTKLTNGVVLHAQNSIDEEILSDNDQVVPMVGMNNINIYKVNYNNDPDDGFILEITSEQCNYNALFNKYELLTLLRDIDNGHICGNTKDIKRRLKVDSKLLSRVLSGIKKSVKIHIVDYDEDEVFKITLSKDIECIDRTTVYTCDEWVKFKYDVADKFGLVI